MSTINQQATNQQVVKISSTTDLKKVMAGEYQKQIINYLGSEKKGLKFLSAVVGACQRNPKLLECEPVSLINSFMTMAQLDLMPSDVSGEAYVIPYDNSKKQGNGWVKVKEAQFQLGYQGLVTLFYRAGVKKIVAELVCEKDKFSYVNGEVNHEQDPFSDRGKPKGAYVIVTLSTGATVSKVMSKEEILDIAHTFSKSFSSSKSPWLPEFDPQLWMWRKTVLKQCAKLVPKNESLIAAIGEDNKDSVIRDRLEPAMEESMKSLTMGAAFKSNNQNGNDDEGRQDIKESEESVDAEGGDPSESDFAAAGL